MQSAAFVTCLVQQDEIRGLAQPLARSGEAIEAGDVAIGYSDPIMQVSPRGRVHR